MTVARFWREQPNRYNLLGTKCGSCGKTYFPPREICLDCHRKSIGKMKNIKLAGTGKVISYSIIHEATDNFKTQVPYVIAIVELDEGTRITGQIVNANCSSHEPVQKQDQKQVQKQDQVPSDKNQDDFASRSNTCTRIKEIEIGSRVSTVFRKISEDGKSGIIHYGYKFKID